ncbi:hypothetical protein F5B17DRAFT_358974 [Nemania serpens]|nr:hypothetical protein F5B17DRAFT_358974 [Nemania serpens]
MSGSNHPSIGNITIGDILPIAISLYKGIRLIDGLAFETLEKFHSPIDVWMPFISRTDFQIPADDIPGKFTEALNEMLEICSKYYNKHGLVRTIEDYSIIIERLCKKRHPLNARNIEDVLRLFVKARRRFRDIFPDRDTSGISSTIDAIDDFIDLISD